MKVLFKKRTFQTHGVRGSNQYQTIMRVKKTQPSGRAYLAAITVGIALAYAATPSIMSFVSDTRYQPAYAPTIEKAYAKPIVLVTPTPDPKNLINQEIREVFGKDSDKAFRLLSCENASHNPDAVNTAGNFPKGSRDIGVFQINEHWQATQGKFLFNPSINIRIAKQLFDENGKTFHLWTCGRRLSI